MKYSLFIGRWQPFHEGHKALINTVLAEGKNVLIAMLDAVEFKDNQYTVDPRRRMIFEAYPALYGDRVIVITIPDIEAVCFGRWADYEMREIHLPLPEPEPKPKPKPMSGTAPRVYRATEPQSPHSTPSQLFRGEPVVVSELYRPPTHQEARDDNRHGSWLSKVPEFPNEINPNPVTAIDLLMQDGGLLRFKMPAVQQSRVMWAMGRLLASLDVELDIELPEATPAPNEDN